MHTHSVSKYTQNFVPVEFEEPKEGAFGPSLNVLNVAIAFGLEIFGFSDHSYELFRYPHLDEDNFLNSRGLLSLREYIYLGKSLKEKYNDIIKIYHGIELYIDEKVTLLPTI